MFRDFRSRFGAFFFALLLSFSVLLINGCKSNLLNAEGAPQPQVEAPAQPLPPVLSDGTRTSYADIVERVSPAVVMINVDRKEKGSSGQFPLGLEPNFPDFFGGPGGPGQPQQRQRPQIQRGLGSGVIVSADGTILTNHHVIEGADKITVEMADKRTFVAKVVGSDPPSDLAVIKVEAKDLPFLTLGDSDKARIGDIILAIGNPLGIGQTVTAGIISAKGRRTGINDGGFEDFLQIDAPINQGNSGGALVNLNGELIGINSQILSRSGGNIGIGFSIPSNMAKPIMDQLLKDGKVRRGQLGVVIQPLTDEVAKSLDLKDTKGVIVSSIKSGSAAEKAGVKRGDVITAINGEKVEDGNTLRNKVASTAPGSDVSITIVRDGKEQELKIRLDEFTQETAKKEDAAPDQPSGKTADNGKLGLSLQPVTPDIEKKLQLEPGTKGLVVVDVDPDGPAAEQDVRPGDVIMEINRQPVESTDDVQSALDKAGERPSLFLIVRRGQTAYITIQPKQ